MADSVNTTAAKAIAQTSAAGVTITYRLCNSEFCQDLIKRCKRGKYIDGEHRCFCPNRCNWCMIGGGTNRAWLPMHPALYGPALAKWQAEEKAKEAVIRKRNRAARAKAAEKAKKAKKVKKDVTANI